MGEQTWLSTRQAMAVHNIAEEHVKNGQKSLSCAQIDMVREIVTKVFKGGVMSVHKSKLFDLIDERLIEVLGRPEHHKAETPIEKYRRRVAEIVGAWRKSSASKV